MCSQVAGRAALDGAGEQLVCVSSCCFPVSGGVAGSVAAEGACEETCFVCAMSAYCPSQTVCSAFLAGLQCMVQVAHVLAVRLLPPCPGAHFFLVLQAGQQRVHVRTAHLPGSCTVGVLTLRSEQRSMARLQCTSVCPCQLNAGGPSAVGAHPWCALELPLQRDSHGLDRHDCAPFVHCRCSCWQQELEGAPLIFCQAMLESSRASLMLATMSRFVVMELPTTAECINAGADLDPIGRRYSFWCLPLPADGIHAGTDDQEDALHAEDHDALEGLTDSSEAGDSDGGIAETDRQELEPAEESSHQATDGEEQPDGGGAAAAAGGGPAGMPSAESRRRCDPCLQPVWQLCLIRSGTYMLGHWYKC